MITVDISNVWGQVALPDLLGLEKEIAQAHQTLHEGTGAGADLRGWMDLPEKYPPEELEKLKVRAEQIREESEVCVVTAIGGSCHAARAAIELLQGRDRNLDKEHPVILWAGSDLSTRSFRQLTRHLEGKEFSLVAISQSGATLESTLAFRNLRWLLERRYGTEEAAQRITVVTAPCQGAFCEMARDRGWTLLSMAPQVGGRYSALTAAGLLPMAVAGLDVEAILRGAAGAKEDYALRSFENPVWLYAAMRNLLYRKGKCAELFAAWEPGFHAFGKWWQQLFGESEGKKGKGLLPVSLEYPADLHCMGQLVQQGRRDIFETMLRFAPGEPGVSISADATDADGLNYLTDRELSFVEDCAFQGTLDAHVDGGLSVITMDCGEAKEETVGDLFYFMELACAISAYTLGVNPFNQPGTEAARRNTCELLARP